MSNYDVKVLNYSNLNDETIADVVKSLLESGFVIIQICAFASSWAWHRNDSHDYKIFVRTKGD